MQGCSSLRRFSSCSRYHLCHLKQHVQYIHVYMCKVSNLPVKPSLMFVSVLNLLILERKSTPNLCKNFFGRSYGSKLMRAVDSFAEQRGMVGKKFIISRLLCWCRHSRATLQISKSLKQNNKIFRFWCQSKF